MRRNLQLRFVTKYGYDLAVILCLFIFVSKLNLNAQTFKDSIKDFNFLEANKHALFYTSTNQKNEFLKNVLRNHILETYFLQNKFKIF